MIKEATKEPEMTAQNQALFVTLCIERGASKAEAVAALSRLQIPEDFDNDAFRYAMLQKGEVR